MAAAVHFKFKSAKDYDTVTFDGEYLKVADLKVAIFEQKKLSYGEGFDLQIQDAQTGDEYRNESDLVRRNASVIVRRVPGLRPGGILSQQAMARKNERFADATITAPNTSIAPSGATPLNSFSASVVGDVVGVTRSDDGLGESERLDSLIQQSGQGYDRKTFAQPGAFRGGPRVGAGGPMFDRPARPGPSYICHRCQKTGHWIDQCPTNGDKSFDKVRVRRPTGIPTSMLKTVEAPTGGTGLQLSSGQFVTLQPNEDEFTRQTAALRRSRLAKQQQQQGLAEKAPENAAEQVGAEKEQAQGAGSLQGGVAGSEQVEENAAAAGDGHAVVDADVGQARTEHEKKSASDTITFNDLLGSGGEHLSDVAVRELDEKPAPADATASDGAGSTASRGAAESKLDPSSNNSNRDREHPGPSITPAGPHLMQGGALGARPHTFQPGVLPPGVPPGVAGLPPGQPMAPPNPQMMAAMMANAAQFGGFPPRAMNPVQLRQQQLFMAAFLHQQQQLQQQQQQQQQHPPSNIQAPMTNQAPLQNDTDRPSTPSRNDHEIRQERKRARHDADGNSGDDDARPADRSDADRDNASDEHHSKRPKSHGMNGTRGMPDENGSAGGAGANVKTNFERIYDGRDRDAQEMRGGGGGDARDDVRGYSRYERESDWNDRRENGGREERGARGDRDYDRGYDGDRARGFHDKFAGSRDERHRSERERDRAAGVKNRGDSRYHDERDRGRDRARARDRDRNQDRNRVMDRPRDRDAHGRERTLGRDREWDRDRDWERDRVRRERDYERDRERGRDRDRGFGRDRGGMGERGARQDDRWAREDERRFREEDIRNDRRWRGDRPRHEYDRASEYDHRPEPSMDSQRHREPHHEERDQKKNTSNETGGRGNNGNRRELSRAQSSGSNRGEMELTLDEIAQQQRGVKRDNEKPASRPEAASDVDHERSEKVPLEKDSKLELGPNGSALARSDSDRVGPAAAKAAARESSRENEESTAQASSTKPRGGIYDRLNFDARAAKPSKSSDRAQNEPKKPSVLERLGPMPSSRGAGSDGNRRRRPRGSR